MQLSTCWLSRTGFTGRVLMCPDSELVPSLVSLRYQLLHVFPRASQWVWHGATWFKLGPSLSVKLRGILRSVTTCDAEGLVLLTARATCRQTAKYTSSCDVPIQSTPIIKVPILGQGKIVGFYLMETPADEAAWKPVLTCVQLGAAISRADIKQMRVMWPTAGRRRKKANSWINSVKKALLQKGKAIPAAMTSDGHEPARVEPRGAFELARLDRVPGSWSRAEPAKLEPKLELPYYF
ncbi:hypothetical protein FN846DRAFT_997412 [Sphaerosporella brunnea]|uniref:Uncharacterized protein n=1 Tax=Sphaerosporella brunnea TaxID=1250544 RepID=A0A5J5F5X5_9PEZI|nr:hypothetical protein FN846DRAFT_997412 [Sphaerosporella brunnea]